MFQKRSFKSWLLGLGLLICNNTPFQAARITFGSSEALPDYPIAGGVSGCYAGFVGDWLVVAGGCNFPDIPVARGGKKVYYNKVYALNVKSRPYRWVALPDYPFPVAYGAAVETKEGLVCIGGMNDTASLAEVFRIELNPAGQFSYRQLPSLPVAMNNHAATAAGAAVFVAGGNQTGHGKGLYRLESGRSDWKQLADYPGDFRSQPVLLADNAYLYLVGGFGFDAEQKVCHLPSDMIPYSLTTGKWQTSRHLPSSAYSMVGGTGVVCNGTLVLAGGVNPEIFKTAVEGNAPSDYLEKPVDWYQFNEDVLLYGVKSKSWQILRHVKGVNRAGGVLLYHGGCFYMVGGELKPGIRTASVVRYK